MGYMGAANVTIRPFDVKDQVAARNLILAGLADHFGKADPKFTPDLADIMSHYEDVPSIVEGS